MVPDYTIRPATADDVDAIRRVARKSWRAAYDFLEEAVVEEMLAQGYSTEFLAAAIESPDLTLFVGERDGTVAGYVSCEPPTDGGVGQVSIYVSPDHWRGGLGTRLLERAREYLAAEGATAMQDHVLADNRVGNAFYRAHFEQVAETTVELGGETYEANVYRGEI